MSIYYLTYVVGREEISKRNGLWPEEAAGSENEFQWLPPEVNWGEASGLRRWYVASFDLANRPQSYVNIRACSSSKGNKWRPFLI